MADYHMLNDGVFGVDGSDLMDDAANLVNAVSYNSAPINTAGQGMMSQSMSNAPGQNPNVMMPGMVSMQQAPGAQLSGGMSSYHQGGMHSYQPSEVPQKLHQYSVYGSQLQSGNMSGQYVPGGPRLHHLSDPMSSIPDPPQQSSPRTVVPNQMYPNRNMTGGHYSQQMPHNPAQMAQGSAQYPSHYGNVHHSMQQHSVQQVNQNADMWPSSMPHSQMTRPCIPPAQSYSQHQLVPGQHSGSNINHSPLTMQGQRPSTPNQSQYMGNQEYATHATNQQSSMQRPPMYSMNSTPVNQNGSMVGQMNNTPQPGLSQTLNSLPQNDQSLNYPQGHYVGSQTPANRPHYNTAAAVGTNVSHPSQQHVSQQMLNVRPSVHQMGYSPVSSRVNSGPQHTGSVPPGSPARLQQYHPPFSPNQSFSASQPSPRPPNPETATPPHLHYPNSQSHAQAPMSPQYRNPFPSQVTHSPQHMTPTPPAEVSVPPPLTPERNLQSSTPQSQGSYHSPSTTHLTSPSQGHSPGNSNAPSSLQHLEQMVMPRVSTGSSTASTAASASPSGPNANLGLNSGVSGSYYGHLPNTPHTQQHHMSHLPSVGDARPQPQSPAFTHVSQQQQQQQHNHHNYLNQPPHSVNQLPSPTVTSVPNSQPLQPNVSTISSLSNSSLLSEESIPVESSQHSIISYGSDNSSSMPSVNVTESSVPRTVSSNVTTLPTSEQMTQMSCASNSSSDSVMQSSHQYTTMGKTPYQGSASSITYEMQQIQQELQQLYGMHQSSEVHEKINALQERIRYLQTQQSSSANSAPPTLNSNVPPNTHYSQTMLYNNSGNTAAYGHPPVVPPHSVHYNSRVPQPSHTQDVPVPASQQGLGPVNMNLMLSDGLPNLTEQCPEPEALGSNHYPVSGSDIMPTLPLQDNSDMAPDPYEMNFNDEPPPKMKRRPPKEPKPKKPKSPKTPKSPKPKKTKKGKKGEEPSQATPNLEGLPIAPDSVVPNPESLEGMPAPQFPSEQGMDAAEVTPPKSKPKKARKRKSKETDGSEPKEPKPKKPRKKPEKKSKQPKTDENLLNEEIPNDGNNNSIDKNEDEKPPDNADIPAEGSEETKENVEGSAKEVREKKSSKSKSPKSKDGAPKEPKKSTPKKKLPKIALRFTSKKKKKKPLAVSDNSDIEGTPPPSPKEGDGITKRRSARNTERKKYTDDIELHLSDDETIEMDFGQNSKQEGKLVQIVVDNHNEDYMVVEKILAVRTVKKQLESMGSDAENESVEPVDVEEYYVKYKNLSYIHCEWKTLEELEKGDRRFIQKVKRFKQKKET